MGQSATPAPPPPPHARVRACNSSMVNMGSAAATREYTCTRKGGNYSSGEIHTVHLTPLTPGETYQYHIAGQPHSTSFRMPPGPAIQPHPVTMAFIGDLGQTVHSNSTVSHLANSSCRMWIKVCVRAHARLEAIPGAPTRVWTFVETYDPRYSQNRYSRNRCVDHHPCGRHLIR